MAGISESFAAADIRRHLHDRPVPQRLHNFSADGYVLQISNERLANIIEKLSQPEQRLLILRFVLDLNDREIGRMMRCSRSAIQRRRTSVLLNLRKQLTGELL